MSENNVPAPNPIPALIDAAQALSTVTKSVATIEALGESHAFSDLFNSNALRLVPPVPLLSEMDEEHVILSDASGIVSSSVFNWSDGNVEIQTAIGTMLTEIVENILDELVDVARPSRTSTDTITFSVLKSFGDSTADRSGSGYPTAWAFTDSLKQTLFDLTDPDGEPVLVPEYAGDVRDLETIEEKHPRLFGLPVVFISSREGLLDGALLLCKKCAFIQFGHDPGLVWNPDSAQFVVEMPHVYAIGDNFGEDVTRVTMLEVISSE